jgi:hypothetical protein
VVELGRWTCARRIQNRRNGGTYSSALDSARAGLALLPAAAEANEGGAIVVGGWWLVVGGREVAVGRIVAFKGHRFWYAKCGNTRHGELVARAGERMSSWLAVRAWWVRVEWCGRVVVQGKCSRVRVGAERRCNI